MSKITVSDKLRFIAIMQILMDEYEARGNLAHESDGVKALFAKAYQRYNKQSDAILQPKPKQPRPLKKSPAQQEYENLTRTQTADGHYPTTGKVIPVPDGFRNDSDIRKRVRK